MKRSLLLGIAPLLLPVLLGGRPAPGVIVPVQQSHGGHEHSEVTGVVNTVDAAGRKLNVTHDPVPSLGWPSMTMEFPVGQSVDLSAVRPGSRVAFTLMKGTGGAYEVDSLKALPRR